MARHPFRLGKIMIQFNLLKNKTLRAVNRAATIERTRRDKQKNCKPPHKGGHR